MLILHLCHCISVRLTPSPPFRRRINSEEDAPPLQAAESDSESDDASVVPPKRKRPSRAARSFIQFEAEVDGDASDDEDESDFSEDSFINDNEDELDL